MSKPSVTIVTLITLLILISACEPAAPTLPVSTFLPALTPTLTIASPSPSPLVATSTVDPSVIKFTYRPPAPKLSLPDVLFEDTGAVVYHGGQFHLFYNCQYDWPPSYITIAYAVSQDGLVWQQVKTDTIIAEADIPYPAHSILASTVFVLDEGTWVFYFYSWANGLDFFPPSLIGRATAPSPEGPWTVDPEPVLVPDPAGWDSDTVQRPDVIFVDGTYYMYYVGTGPAGSMIGMAASSDGIHWTKYNDPATTDPVYANSDPVFTPQQEGAGDLELRYPRVLITPDGWLLFYWTNTPGWPQANPYDPTNGRISLAASPDGIHWITSQEEPVLTPEDIGDGVTAIYTPVVVYLEDVYYMFLEMELYGRGNITTRVILATHEGLLFP